MNFVEVHVEGSGDGARLVGPGRLVDPAAAALPRGRRADSAGKTLVAGFRPEHLDIGEAGPARGSFRARADVVEYLGNEELLHVNAADQDIVAIVDSEHRVRPGDIVNLDPAARQAPPVRRRDRRLTLAPGRRPRPSPERRPPDQRPDGPGGSLRGRSRRARRRLAGPPSRARYLSSASTRSSAPTARAATRDIAGHPGAVAIVALDAEDRVLLVRQYRRRRRTRRCSRSRPARLDIGDDGTIEDPDARRAARARGGDRHARRRRGASSARSTRRPGFTDELMHLYLATDLAPADGRAPRARRGRAAASSSGCPWREAVAAAERGEIRDAKSIVGLFWLARVMRPGPSAGLASAGGRVDSRPSGPSRASASRYSGVSGLSATASRRCVRASSRRPSRLRLWPSA